MATAAFQISAANFRGDTTSVVPIVDVADTNIGKWVAQYANATSVAYCCCYFPDNYLSGNLTAKVRVRSTAGTVAQVKQFPAAYIFQASNTANANSTTALTHQDITYAAAKQIEELTFTLSAGGINASRILCFRLDSNATGTLPTAEVLDVNFEYTMDPAIRKGYLWIPANAFVIPSGSGATLTSRNIAATVVPWALAMRDANSDYVDVTFQLPSSYRQNLTLTTVWNAGGTGITVWRHDMAAAAVGASSDPTLTTGTSFSGASQTAANNYFDALRAAPITPAASNEIELRVTRLGSDGSDTSTTTSYLYGVMIAWDTTDKNPAFISLDPLSGAQSTLVLDTDTNNSKIVQQFAPSADAHADYGGQLPSVYGSGGTVRVRWRTSSANTSDAVHFRLDNISPAVSASSDSSLTTGSAANYASTGAGQINEFTYDISSALVASDNVFIRLNRLGSADSMPGTVEILSMALEFSLS